jgi:hypothetical protein
VPDRVAISGQSRSPADTSQDLSPARGAALIFVSASRWAWRSSWVYISCVTAKCSGYEQVYDVDEIITRMPTPTEIERRGISTGTPVAEHIRTGYTAENRAVRVMVSIITG